MAHHVFSVRGDVLAGQAQIKPLLLHVRGPQLRRPGCIPCAKHSLAYAGGMYVSTAYVSVHVIPCGPQISDRIVVTFYLMQLPPGRSPLSRREG